MHGSRGPAGVPDFYVVEIVVLKRWASVGLRSALRLCFLLLCEMEELSIGEFLIKMELWTKLLAEETRQSRRGYT